MRKEYDFSKAKRASDIPHLAKLQAKGKSAVTLLLDNDLLVAFHARADAEGIDCNVLINKVLQDAISELDQAPGLQGDS